MSGFQVVQNRKASYTTQMQKLLDMGFESSACLEALDSTSGDIEAAVVLLIGGTIAPSNPPAARTTATKSARKGQSSSSKSEVKDLQTKFMTAFKTQKCKAVGNHDKRMCFHFHSKADRRRNPFEISYTCVECPNSSETSNCPEGDSCLKAHTLLERMFHPELFKISFCQRGPNGSHCERGNFCAFAHSEEDHRIPLSQSLRQAAQTANAASYPETLQPGKLLSDSKYLDQVKDKLIRLIKSSGSDGIMSSELPKRYFDAYAERLELTDEAGGKFRIKDLLLQHPNISVSMHKGVQPKYVYGETKIPNSTNAATHSSAVAQATSSNAKEAGTQAWGANSIFDTVKGRETHSSISTNTQLEPTIPGGAGPGTAAGFDSQTLQPSYQGQMGFSVFGSVLGSAAGEYAAFSPPRSTVGAIGDNSAPTLGLGSFSGDSQSSFGTGATGLGLGLGVIGAVGSRRRVPTPDGVEPGVLSGQQQALPSAHSVTPLSLLLQQGPELGGPVHGHAGPMAGFEQQPGFSPTQAQRHMGHGHGLSPSAGAGGGGSAAMMVEYSERLSQANAECAQLRNQVTELRTDLDNRNAEYVAQAKHLSDILKRMKTMENFRKPASSTEIDSYVAQNLALQEDITAANEALKLKDSELATAKDSLKEKEAALVKAEKTKNSLIPELKLVRTKLSATETELAEAKAQTTKTERAKQLLAAENENLRTELTAARRSPAAAAAASSNAAAAEDREALKELKDELTKCQSQKEKLSEEVISLEAKLRTKQALEDEIDGLRAEQQLQQQQHQEEYAAAEGQAQVQALKIQALEAQVQALKVQAARDRAALEAQARSSPLQAPVLAAAPAPSTSRLNVATSEFIPTRLNVATSEFIPTRLNVATSEFIPSFALPHDFSNTSNQPSAPVNTYTAAAISAPATAAALVNVVPAAKVANAPIAPKLVSTVTCAFAGSTSSNAPPSRETAPPAVPVPVPVVPANPTLATHVTQAMQPQAAPVSATASTAPGPAAAVAATGTAAAVTPTGSQPAKAPTQAQQTQAQEQSANQSSLPIDPEVSTCSLPGCTRDGPFICGGCKKTGYCGPAHQKEHWKIHGKECAGRRGV